MLKLDPPIRDRPYAIITGAPGQTPASLPESELVEAYKTYGALLFRGFDMDLGAFGDLTKRYCASSVFNESPDREVLDGDANIQTVDGGTEEFQLHPELSREPWKPDVCFFYCIDAPGEGGETTLCDGVDLVKNLPPAAYEALHGRRLRYPQPASPEACAFWLGDSNPSDEALRNPPATCPYTFFRGPKGGVIRVFSRPAFHTPMFTAEPAFGNFLLFARFQNGRRGFPTFENGEAVPEEVLYEVKATGDRLKAPIRWQPGDVIMIDNTRFMHGRNPIIEPRERRIATFFGYLKFAAPDAEEITNAPWRSQVFRPPKQPPRRQTAS
jgi:alpha-ketoglutarate-dependent taurine dioxygenase